MTQHLCSYVELGAAAAAEYRSAWARRLLLGLLVAVTGIAGLGAAWGAGLIALWNTPWRLAYVAVTALLLLATAGWALWMLLKEQSAGPMAGILQSELRKDMELFQQWKNTL